MLGQSQLGGNANVTIRSLPEAGPHCRVRNVDPQKLDCSSVARSMSSSMIWCWSVTVFPLSWVFLFTQQGPARFLVIEAIGAAVGVGTIMLSGYVADRVGRDTLLGVTAAAIAAFSGFAPQLLDGGDVGEILFMVLGFVLLGLSFGQSSGAVAKNFSKAYRYTGSALTSDLAWLFGAGFAPLVALFLSARFGLMAAGAYLLSGAVCTVIALFMDRQLDARDR